MSIIFRNFSRISLASVIGTALAIASISSAAEAKSPVRAFVTSPANSVKATTAATSTARGIPSNLKAGIQNLSKADLSKVNVHLNQKPAGSLNANAFAKGGKIHLAPGQAKHLPHETWHAVQQKQGRVTGQAGRVNSLNHAKSVSSAGKTSNFAKRANSARTIAKTHQTAKVARHANNARKVAKAAKFAKVAAAGTGVGAVVGITAGLAGVDPIEMAALKATDPAEYNRRMAALKKDPVKYMGNNIKNNTVKTVNDVKKAGAAVGKATQTASKAVGTAANKAGCGIGNVFKKKGDKAKC